MLYAVLTLLTLSGSALSQEVENGPETANSAYIAAGVDTAAVADSAAAAAQEPDNRPAIDVYVTGDSIPKTTTDTPSALPEPDNAAAVAVQEQDNVPVIDSPAALEQPILQPIQQTVQSKRNTFWIAVGADIAGAGIFGFGLYEEMNVRDLISKGKFPAAESKETVRNVCYVIGTLVLAAGISIHVFF